MTPRMKNVVLFEKYRAGRHWERHPTAYAERFAEFLTSVSFNQLLVDLGCGTGRDVKVFHERGFDVIGIDNSADEIKRAKKACPSCRFEIQDIEHLSFPDESVGAFFMINVIHYVDQRTAVREVFRTLRKGGLMFIHFNLQIVDEDGDVDYEQKRSDIDELISPFEIVEKRMVRRADSAPKKHTHTILELILRKPL